MAKKNLAPSASLSKEFKKQLTTRAAARNMTVIFDADTATFTSIGDPTQSVTLTHAELLRMGPAPADINLPEED